MKYHHIYPNFFSLTPLILLRLCLSLNLCYFVFFDKPLVLPSVNWYGTNHSIRGNLTVLTSIKESDSPSPGSFQLTDTIVKVELEGSLSHLCQNFSWLDLI